MTMTCSNNIPEAFLCPLTLELMEDPVMTREGKNFEREAIVEWLNRGNVTCPLTRQPLTFSKLIPNASLRLQIEIWKKESGIEVTVYEKKCLEDLKLLCLIDTGKRNKLEDVEWCHRMLSSPLQPEEELISDRPGNNLERRNGGHRRRLVGILDSALRISRRSRDGIS